MFVLYTVLIFNGGIDQLQYFFFLNNGKIKIALALFKQKLFVKYILSNVE